jgi:hypothetical protein
MTPEVDTSLQRALKAAFKMPAVQTLVSRKSSITNAFVSAIIPVVVPSWDEIHEAIRILELDPHDLRCAYCGDKASEWDHLRPLVIRRRPTGYISEIANLVPSCGKCNQSKGNKDWRSWMLSGAKLSPTGRGVAGINARIQRLDSFVNWRVAAIVDFQQMVGDDCWTAYWQSCERLVEQMIECQREADALKERILNAFAQRGTTPQREHSSSLARRPPN